LKENTANQADLTELIDGALLRLNMLYKLYKYAEIEEKRLIIGSIYPEKWRISDEKIEPLK
jgi:hypothetical protein